MEDSFATIRPRAGFPARENNDAYLEPKQLAFRYGLAYSTFLKHLKLIVREGDYQKEAFRVPRQNPLKREHARIRIHPVHGVAVLDHYFDARRNTAV